MQTTPASLALAAMGGRDPTSLERAFLHLDEPSLSRLREPLDRAAIGGDADPPTLRDGATYDGASYRAIGRALLRRCVHRALDRRSAALSASASLGIALREHELPGPLGDSLAERYGGQPPRDWGEALDRLRDLAGGSTVELWRLILDHPMTEYVPVQCSSCGHVFPDRTDDGLDDDAVGLTEVEPTPEERPRIRSGWFRGPRGPVVFSLRCPDCGATSRWYRSSDPGVTLNPDRWGRLCGEQEDLRLCLAEYLGVSVRTILPLDWDHVWSEYRADDSPSAEGGEWSVQDPSARNFAVRLDEGIGAWTAVLAVGSEPDLCADVTDEYLRCKGGSLGGGRADDEHEGNMPHYCEMVASARRDSTGSLTQARTLNGYVLHMAGFTSQTITSEMRRAAEEYGTCPWWKLPN